MEHPGRLIASLALVALVGCDRDREPVGPRTLPPATTPAPGQDRMAFTPPDEGARARAIGSVADARPELARAFTPGDDFRPVPRPGPSDWLASHPEPGQTFSELVASHPNRPTDGRRTLYLLPLGTFGDEAPSLDELERFAEAFFVMPVELLAPVDLSRAGITSRENPGSGHRQLLTGDILELLRRRLPDDAFALLGITMIDLYPKPSWNFVFGQASLRDRVGVYSFARYDPRFHGQPLEGGGRKMLIRSAKVLAHETGHMFGIHHCIWFHCLMNGSNHLEESDARPLHLCPVDLRKLHYSIGFDPAERYAALELFWRDHGVVTEADWLAERRRFIVSGQ